MLERLWQDLSYAVRVIRRAPGFTAIAVLSLALGIGANTAVFSLIDKLMLQLLPVSEPTQLVELLQHYPGEPRGNGYWSWPSYQYYRDHNHVFSGLIAFTAPSRAEVRGEGLPPESVNAMRIAGNFFPVLGVKPAAGRLIAPGDDSTVAVVSWAFWKDRFNLDPTISGKRIVVQELPFTVVGVTPPDFQGLQVGSKTDIWLTLVPSPSTRVALMGRLKPGVSLNQARAELTGLYRFSIDERAATSKDPLLRRLRIEIESAGAGLSILRDTFAKPLWVLMGLVSMVLLIACTNVAGLLLARGAARQTEMAVRVSLGATRFRILCQVLTECLLLSCLGSLLGIFLAYFGAFALVRILTSGRPIIGLAQPLELSLRPDLRVLLFTAGVALFTGVLFGLGPAWNAFASAPARSLARFRRLFGSSLVVAQVAVSVVLLSAAGLFVRHLSNLQHMDLGFRRDHILLVTPDRARIQQIPAAYRDVLERLERIPGVRSASLSAPTPLSGAGAAGFASIEGFDEPAADRRYISISWVAPNCFETLGIPLLAGRDFDAHDERQSRAAIVNRAMARHYFPNSDPIGKQVTLEHVTGSTEDKSYEIVGLVGDTKYSEIGEPANRIVYLPAFQDGRVYARSFVLRTMIDPDRIKGDVLKTIPQARVTTLTDQIDASIVPERLIATLSGSFGVLGATLAGIGLYGLLVYTVTRRVTEFGIRLALGATSRHLLRMVIGDAMKLVCAGLIIGTPVALWSKNLASGFIQEVQTQSAVPIAFGVLAMLSLALLAAALPARRAATVDPMEALRHE